jgi:hypothetical protein
MAKLNFKNMESLQPFVNVLNEAEAALNEPSRTIATSSIPDVLGAVAGMGAGGAASFAALIFGGKVVGLSAAGITSGLAAAGLGGGMVAGVAVLAAPIAILGIVGYAVANGVRGKKLRQEKFRLYQAGLQKLDAIIRELDRKLSLSESRVKYLESLNILLRQGIEYLKADLTNG